MAPPPVLVLLVLWCAARTGALQPLVAHKCCPQGESLRYSSPLSCARAPGPSDAPRAGGGSPESVAAAEPRSDGGFPAWMDARLQLHDDATLAPLERPPPETRVRYGGHPLCPEADRQVVSAAARHRYKLLASGALLLDLSTWGGAGEVRLSPDDFCADRLDEAPEFPNGTHVFVACPCRRVPCVRKCCPPGAAFAERLPTGQCGAPEGVDWRPQFRRRDLSPAAAAPTHHLLAGAGQRLDCGDNGSAVLLNANGREGNRLWVFGNASVLLDNFGYGVPFDGHRWCGESTRLGNGSVAENVVFCMANSAEEPVAAGVQTLGALFLLGAFFLLLTLCVYALLPELRAPAHAKALMCHSAALLVGSVVLGSMQLTASVPGALCEGGAVIIQFFFLAAFFWLNVLCIDISWAFSGLRALLGSLLDTSRRKFLYYSLYAWGCPFAITAVTVGVHTAHKHNALPQWVVVPNFGGMSCWFDGAAAHWAYFYGPMAVLLAVNTALFVFTAARLARAHCDSAELNRGDSVRHDRSSRLSADKRRFILYTKLFLLMGVTWLLEVVSWSLQQDANPSQADEWWMLSDVINTLRGVFIFVIFCCKGKVLHMLRKRLGGWGLPGGLPADAVRSATSRSQASTRQSSLLQLAPGGEDASWWQRRTSVPSTLSALGAAYGRVGPLGKEPRKQSVPTLKEEDETKEEKCPLPPV